MTYQQIADLGKDEAFLERLAAAVTEQAKSHSDYAAESSLRSPSQGATMFMPFVSTEPGFAAAYGEGGQEAITDGMMLSAIQANWDAVNTLWAPISTPISTPL
jgi:hypothetical protein